MPSRITNLFASSGLLGSSMSPRDRTTDGLTRLRFTLETLPGSKKFIFTPPGEAEVPIEIDVVAALHNGHGEYLLFVLKASGKVRRLKNFRNLHSTSHRIPIAESSTNPQ